jgi:hypothetical protein
MISIPVLHIIFYLATLFLPTGTTKFTTSYPEHKVTWTRQEDGWHGTADLGQNIGIWSVSGLEVSVTEHTATAKTDLSKFIKSDTSTDQKKQVSVDERPVTISSSESTITFSQDKDGIFAKPVVITYSSK